MLNSGIVHQNIDLSQCVPGFCYQITASIGIGHVRLDVDHPLAGLCRQFFGNRMVFGRIAKRVQDNIGTPFRQNRRNAQPNARV